MLPLVLSVFAVFGLAQCDMVATQVGAGDGSRVAMSSDGTKFVAGMRNGDLYTSTGGMYWTAMNLGSKIWLGVAMSADGSKIAAAAYGGSIWISVDSGAMWLPASSQLLLV